MFSRRGFSRDGYAGFGGPQAGPHGPQPPQSPYRGGNPFAGGGQGGNPYAGQPNLTPDQLAQMYGAPPAGPAQTGRMTIDDVVMRTAATLGTVVVMAVIGWLAIPVDSGRGIGIGASVLGFVIGMLIIFRRTISPPLILTYAALQGVFIGYWSHTLNTFYDGVVAQAVVGTLGVFAGTLAAYKYGVVRVTPRYQRVGMAIAIGFVVLTAVNLIAALIGGGDGLGLRSGGLGILVGIVGVLLGAFFLTLDFNEIERGVQQGARSEESWMAAFGLTLSLVWIYLELLRLLAILRD
jgi:uncharacterized YccA/Bax inhibitor family protein